MRSVNKVILIGNLTRDPEMRETPSGQPVCTFGIATNREWVTKNNEHKSSAEFHECVAWARLAEICGRYLKKGKLVYLEGYLKTRSWETPEGVKKFKTEIIVQDMIMLEKRPKDAEDLAPYNEGGATEEIDNFNSTSDEESNENESSKVPTESTEESATEEPPEPTEKEAKDDKKEKKNADVNIDDELGL